MPLARRSGFTLIEMIAVIVLLGLAATALSLGFSGTADNAALEAGVASLRAADRQARFLAVCGEPVVMSVQRHEVVLVSETLNRRIPAPAGVVIRLHEPESETPLETVTYDRLGRAEHYRARVTLNGLWAEFTVSGSTGWISQESGGPG